jgi:hypothetical protein
MQNIVTFWRSIVGDAVEYFTIGSSNSPQWNYGSLLEYMFAGLAAILVIALVFRLLFTIVGFFSPKR